MIRIAFTRENAARINLIFRLANLLFVSFPFKHIMWSGNNLPEIFRSSVHSVFDLVFLGKLYYSIILRRLLPLFPSGTMNAAAAEEAPLRRISDLQKNSLPAMSRRGPEAGDFRILHVFHSPGVKRINSSLFLQSNNFPLLVMPQGCITWS